MGKNVFVYRCKRRALQNSDDTSGTDGDYERRSLGLSSVTATQSADATWDTEHAHTVVVAVPLSRIGAPRCRSSGRLHDSCRGKPPIGP